MSAYRGRTGPNVSQYLTGLNTVSPPENMFGEDNDFSNDLAMYTNTDFTNLDMPTFAEDGAFNFDLSPDNQSQDDLKYEDLLASSGPSIDFDVGAITNPVNTSQQQLQPQPFISTYNTPIQPAPSQDFSPLGKNVQNVNTNSNPNQSRPATAQSPTENMSQEEKSRLAAEEDKRRRNTAASARFRVKKKQREQALEKTLKETQEKNSKLEAKVTQLELENKWLKELITEKNGLSSKEEMAAAYEQHRKESEERVLKSETEHTSGVGTS